MKKVLTLTLLLVFVSTQAFGKIWIRGKNVNSQDFLVKVRTEPRDVTFTDAYLKTPAPPKKLQALIERFKKAQQTFLVDDQKEARRDFERVLELRFDADWPTTYVRIFLYSYLRLAQLTPDLEERTQLYRNAARFCGPLAPDEKVFSEKYISEYLEVRETENSKRTVWTPEIEGAEYILIDGRPFLAGANERLEITQGQHRLTVISNTSKTYSAIIDAETLLMTKIRLTPWVVNLCTAEESVKVNGIMLNVFKGDLCIPKEQVLTKTQDNQAPLTEPNFMTMFGTEKPKEEVKVSSNKTWLWATLGVVAAGVIASVVAENQRRAGPSAPPAAGPTPVATTVTTAPTTQTEVIQGDLL